MPPGWPAAVPTARLCGTSLCRAPDAVSAVQPLVHWAAYLPPEQGQPKPEEQPTAFIAVLQDDPPARRVQRCGCRAGAGQPDRRRLGPRCGQLHHGGHRPPGADRGCWPCPMGVRLCYMVALGYPAAREHAWSNDAGRQREVLSGRKPRLLRAEAQHGRGAAENAVKVKIAVPMMKSGLRFFVSVRSGVFQPYPKIAKLCAPRDSVSLTISALPMVY